jgi:hypothetical protein
MEALQAKADVVSAVCIIAEVKLSHPKFLAFAPNWGNSQRADFRDPLNITVHGQRWQESSVVVKTDGTAKYLGVRLDMDLTHNTNFRFALDLLTEKCAIIRARKGSADTKYMVLRRSLIEKIAYHGKFMTWDLAQYEKLDSVIQGTYRHITHNMRGFPDALLSTPHALMGLGLDRISDVCQERKASLVHRMSEGCLPTTVAMQGLLIRSLRADGVGPHGPVAVSEFVPESLIVGGWWGASLREWVARAGLHYSVGGTLPNDDDESIWARARRTGVPLDRHEVDILSALGLQTVAELSLGAHSDTLVTDRILHRSRSGIVQQRLWQRDHHPHY